MSSAEFQQILFNQTDRVATITLNRPEKLNAWTHTMRNELCVAIERCNNDPGIGAIVITGAGRGFCAGADIGATFKSRIEGEPETDEPKVPDHVESGNWVSFIRRSKPVIGAINGVAVGVGITQALPFDLLLASDRSRVGMFFVKMGLVPELASSQLLVQRVGFALASEMCLTGRLYDAAELEDTGFFNQVVSHEDLLARAQELASQIAANPSSSLLWVKQLLTENGACSDLSLVQQREVALLEQAYESADHKEAVQAFLEKRPPVFE